MKRILKITLGSLAVLLLVAVLVFVFMPRDKLLAMLAPTIDEVAIRNARIGKQKATMDLDMNVKSRLIPVLVDSIAYTFNLHGNQIAQGGQRFEEKTKEGKKQRLIFPVTIDYKTVTGEMRKHEGEQSEVNAQVQAYCKIPLLGIRRIDINRDLPLKIPGLPQIDIQDVDFKKIGLDDLRTEMTINVTNPNDFSMQLTDVAYDLDIGEYARSEGSIPGSFELKANGTSQIKVPISTDLKKPAKMVVKSITGDRDWPYALKASMKVKSGGMAEPVEIESEASGTINVFKTGKKIAGKEEKRSEQKEEKKEKENN